MATMEQLKQQYLGAEKRGDALEAFKAVSEYNAKKVVATARAESDHKSSVSLVLNETIKYRKELLENGVTKEIPIDEEDYIRIKLKWCDYIIGKLKEVVESDD